MKSRGATTNRQGSGRTGPGRLGLPRLVGLIVLLALTLVKYSDPAPLERFKLWVFDQYLIGKPREAGASPVVIVDIDEKSLARIGQWPWSRAVMARLVDRMGEAGAAVIGLDIVFAEPDRLSPPRLARTLVGLTPDMQAGLEREKDTDALFAEAIARQRVVLGRSGLPMAHATNGDEPHLPLAMIGGDSTGLLPGYPGMLRNLPALERAAAGVGMFSILSEPDGLVRRVPLAFVVDGRVVPSLAVEMLRAVTGGDALVIKRDSAGVVGMVVGATMIPTQRDGRFWVYYRSGPATNYISAADLLEGRLAEGALKDKLVLVGSSAIGLQDIRATPVSAAMPGVEVHAQLLETILERRQLTRPHLALGIEVVAGLMLGLLMIWLVPRLGTLPVLALGLLMAFATWQAGWLLFDRYRLLIDMVYPLLAGLSVFLTLVFLNYWREERQRHGIRLAFQHYLAPALVEKLAEQPSLLRLGGETRDLTVLFSDMRDFTRVAEGMQGDPQALTRLMNRLLTPLSDAITREKGTIDKYMGDAVMAFWNAPLDVPDHAAHAARAALAMRQRLLALNDARCREAEGQGLPVPAPLEIGIGINTGPCVVGNMGSDFRFDYSALGDAVNLASRLEGLTAHYGEPILIGEATAAALGERFDMREIGSVQVKGKSEAARVFALLGEKSTSE